MPRVEHIRAKSGTHLATIIAKESEKRSGLPDPVTFFTEPKEELQVGLLTHPVGKVVEPHFHFPRTRKINFTTEVLVIQKGRICVRFYNNDGTLAEQRTLIGGDVVIIFQGGHGLEVLNACEILEVKQGPYQPDEKVPVIVREES